MGFLTPQIILILCVVCYKTEATVSAASNSTVSQISGTPQLSATPQLSMSNVPTVLESSIPVLGTAFGSCMVMPSTCICDQSPMVSVMSTMVNMSAAPTMVVAMTMVSLVNISGSLTSYLSPASSANPPDNQSHHSPVSCNCYGQRTHCLQIQPSTASASNEPTSENTNNNGQNQGNNQGNQNQQEATATASVSGNLLEPSASISPGLPTSIPPAISPGLHTSILPEISPGLPTSILPEISPGLPLWILPSSLLTLLPELPATLDTAAIAPTSTVMATSSVAPTLPTVCDKDCTGKDCGTAIVNACGKCVGGDTGLDVNFGKDCNNICNGTARNDSCGACSNPPPGDRTGTDSPFQDCHGTCFGSAAIDSCGNCSGGSTGKAVDFWRDACGICGGDNSTCAGCDGIPNSGRVNDSCNVCGGDGSTCTTITSVSPSLLPTSSSASHEVVVYGAGLDVGDSIKCVIDGTESTGAKVNRTYCKCTVQSGLTSGSKTFTVKVVKDGADTPTADLTIELYDPATVKITSLTPSEIFTTESTEVTFGSGLLQSSSAVCMVGGTKVPAVFSGGSYKCSLLFANSKEITIDLSLNGVHMLNSDVSLNRTIFARAPLMTSAQFSDTGALINVVFDKDVHTSSLATCADIFDSATLGRLGTSAGCSWSDGRHLTVSPGTNATIAPGGSITLKTNAVKSGGELYSKYASGSLVVVAPANPVKASPKIVAPTQISSCGDLTLDGSQSTGGGGRDLEYTWSLTGTTNGDITAVLDAAANQQKVFINGTLMASGSSYTFKLEISNFLSSDKEEVSIAVSKSANPVPEVTINGPLDGKAFASQSFYITAVAQAASCSSDKALTYTWTAICGNDDSSNAARTRVESSAAFQATSTKSALKIDSGILVGGKNYEFTVVVALQASPSISTTMKFNVTVAWSPLQPAISGGDRTLGRDSGSLTLDGKSSTVDPDNAPGDLSCSWICTDKSNGQPCYSATNRQSKIALPNDCIVTVASSDFSADKSYEITSQVSKGSRTGSSSILLTVVAGNPPAVTVLKPTMTVTAGEKVNLEGKYRSGVSPRKVEWICAQDTNYRFVNISDPSLISSSSETNNSGADSFSVVILKANVLTPGATYKFILNVDDGDNVGSSNMIVVVRSGPTSGSFEANPTTLETLQTVTLTAPLWVTDSDAYPLNYEFGYVDSSGIFHGWATQTSSEYRIAVPSGDSVTNKLKLRLNVKDAFGSTKSLEKDITVTPATTIEEAQVQSLMDDTLQGAKDTGDYSEAVPLLANILQAISEGNASSANLTKTVTNTTVNTLLKAVESTSLDATKAEPILQTFLKLNTGLIEQPDDVVDKFEKVVEAVKDDMNQQTVDETLTWVGSLNLDMTNEENFKDITAIHADLASSMAKQLDLGQPAVETSSNDPRVVLRAEHSLLTGTVPTQSSSQAAQFEFGSDLQGKYGFWECATGKFCLGVKLTFVNYKKDYYTNISSTKPGIVANKIVAVQLENPETGGLLPVSGLTDPVTIKFDTGVPAAGKTFNGYYYSTGQNKWSKDGLTSVMEGSKLKVTTNHFTSFAPAEEDITDVPTGETTTAQVIPDSIFQLSFVLPQTSWNDTYLNSSHPDYNSLKDLILQELTKVYENDTTLKNIDLDAFEKSGDNVKVLLKMTFDSSNEDPSALLKESVADGKLGSLDIDKDSITWVSGTNQSESEDDDDVELIIGTVFGVFFGLAIILLVAAWLKNRQSRRKIGSSHPSVEEEPQEPVDEEEAETPA